MCITCDVRERMEEDTDWPVELIEDAIFFLSEHYPELTEGKCAEHAVEALYDRARMLCSFAYVLSLSDDTPSNESAPQPPLIDDEALSELHNMIEGFPEEIKGSQSRDGAPIATTYQRDEVRGLLDQAVQDHNETDEAES